MNIFFNIVIYIINIAIIIIINYYYYYYYYSAILVIQTPLVRWFIKVSG